MQTSGLENQPWFPNKAVWSDFFLYGKSRCVHLMVLIMGILLIGETVGKKHHKFEKEWFLVLLMGVFQLIAAFTSVNAERSFLGSIEQFESIGVLLGYLVIGAYAYRCMLKSEDSKILFGMLLTGTLISCCFGISQILQMDFWESEIGKKILIPQTWNALRESLRFNFSVSGWGQVYLASYNPNYAGIYLLMILPLAALWDKPKVRWLTLPIIICLVGTFSRTVIIALIVLIALGMLLFQHHIFKTKKKCCLLIISMAVLIICTGIQISKNDAVRLTGSPKLQSVSCGEDSVKITYQQKRLKFSFFQTSNGEKPYVLTYEDGSKVAMEWDELMGRMIPVEEALEGLSFKVYEKDNRYYGVFWYQEIPFRFVLNETGGYTYVSINGKEDQLETAKHLWQGNEDFLSGRSYIWSRCLPIIQENPLFGTGPDTFIEVFPQDDYVMRSNLGYEFFTQILTNAHSLYLQMALQTGIPTMICFVIFVCIYLWKSWNIYYGKSLKTFEGKMGAALMLSVIGYLICGITFSSSVCTTPVFWILLGMGMAINKKVKSYIENSAVF